MIQPALPPKTRSTLRRRILQSLALLFAILLTVILFVGCEMVSMPGQSFHGPLPAMTAEQQTLSANCRAHVDALATKIGLRSLRTPAHLAAAAAYIEAEFRKQGYTPHSQEFDVEGQASRNIEVEIPGASRASEILVIGAHYDSADDSPAANDNASGVAALLELSRLLAADKPARTVRFVAFANEEPPYYHTEDMGSLVYARRCKERKENIVAMFCLETMGCYSEAANSQAYPFPMSLFYPSTGNFIAFVGDWDSRKLVHKTVERFRNHAQFPSEGAAIPSSITGVDWSDQWSFWQQGYPALMITDTAPFRYAYYHTPQDTADKVDYDRLARVISGLVPTLREFAN
jgi:Zn-dependent M28 family amino/carboxypeptidase